MSRKFSISYFPYPIHDHKTGRFLGNVFRPTAPIQISYRDKKTLPFQALVDSGSDMNLFPANLGEILGIKIKEGKEIIIEGIGKVKIKAYLHKTNLYIEKCVFETEINFSYDQEIPLLGRRGFFDLFKRVDFREKKKMVEFKV